jgi:hypothetical protein
MSPRPHSPIRPVAFEQQINGRDYRIEISRVHGGRWRAEVVTKYGGPTALMPFYGTSADAARDGLTTWLSSLYREPDATR